ncbi:MAG: GntR family transcriptional regulator [Salinarimonas sp.]|nr:GntR family transcriptional regulator [Salinarimonas sp.]
MFWRGKQETESSVVRLLAAQLRRDIAFGILAPDTRLKIDDLRTRYGGSAHSFREALTLLAGEGLVESQAQRGFRVASATGADLEDIQRMRARIEALGLEWSLAHADATWEAGLVAARHALSRAVEAVRGDAAGEALFWDEAAAGFHAMLVSNCRSPRLIAFQERLALESRRFRLAALIEGRVDHDAEEAMRGRVLDAVLARDVGAATAHLSQLFQPAAGAGEDRPQKPAITGGPS